MGKPVTDFGNYSYTPELFNTTAAEQIVPIILKYLDAKSVVDVGCGLGTWLSVFKKHGLEIQGIDGSDTDHDKLWIDGSDFLVRDLREPLDLGRKFDLAMSVEVAEHLPDSAADTFVDTLTDLSDQIVFSAAIPLQTTGHINEQWPSYWIKKFEAKGYSAFDLIRPQVWADDTIETYYRQNIFVLVKNESSIKGENVTKIKPLDLVHPVQYFHNIGILEKDLNVYRSGSIGVVGSLKMLGKAISRKLGM